VNSANIPIRRMVELALAANATSVVLAHNHPSGIAVPSREDVLTTRQLATALGAMDIILADHIVVADEDFVSMVQSNYYEPRNYIR
jgi:DNA repair protein RadC